MEMGLGGKEENVMKADLVSEKESGNCRCSEFEAMCLELEGENELLRSKLRELEREKLAIENELKASKRRNDELNQQIGRPMEGNVCLAKDEEEDKVFQLMAENSVLECEKIYAERRCKELESLIEQLKKGMVMTGPTQAAVENKRVGLCLPDLNCFDATQEEQTNKETESKGGPCPALCSNLTQSGKKFVDSRISFDSLGEGIGDLKAQGTGMGTPYIDTPFIKGEDGHMHFDCQLKKGRVRKRLAFEEDGSCCKRIAPSTPGGARPTSSIIDVLDSDDETDLTDMKMPCQNDQGNGNGLHKTDCLLEETRDSEKGTRDVIYQSPEKIEDYFEDQVPPSLTSRRRRANNIITSDSENDDDNLPISKLFKHHFQKESSNQTSLKPNDRLVGANCPGYDKASNRFTRKKGRRLVKMRRFEGKRKIDKTLLNNASRFCGGIPATEDIGDDSEEVTSENDNDSLNEFIVDDATGEQEDVSDGDSTGIESEDASESSDAQTDPEDTSDDNVNFSEILSQIRRKKARKSEWKFEGEMLTAFEETPELCMRAVCALYRQQTSEEKTCKGSLFQNGRGFSKFHAESGTSLAEFLLDGDPNADLQKTVEELEVLYYGNGLELCRKLARHYSKQLYDIYNNKEDPYFHPSGVTPSRV